MQALPEPAKPDTCVRENRHAEPRHGTSTFSLRVKSQSSLYNPPSVCFSSPASWNAQPTDRCLCSGDEVRSSLQDLYLLQPGGGRPFKDKFPQRLGKYHPGSDTCFVLCLKRNVSLFLAWSRNKPAGMVGTCCRLECSSFLHFLTEPHHTTHNTSVGRLFVQIWRGALREEDEVAR